MDVCEGKTEVGEITDMLEYRTVKLTKWSAHADRFILLGSVCRQFGFYILTPFFMFSAQTK